jgi:lauroyl/myristoyl acyltransferase
VRRISVEGLENLTAALEQRKGAVLLDCPLGYTLIGKAALASLGFTICQIHDERHWGSPSWIGRHVVRPMRRARERSVFSKLVDIEEGSLGYLKTVVSWLSMNRLVCVSAFGTNGMRFVRVPFLGESRRFPTGPVNLGLVTGAAVLAIFCVRDVAGRLHLIISPRLTLGRFVSKESAVSSMVEEYADLVERYVRMYPEQWHRWHQTGSDPGESLARPRNTVVQGVTQVSVRDDSGSTATW